MLVASGDVTITINDDPEKAISVPAGGKLLGVLADQKIFVPSACGGQGTCASARSRCSKAAATSCPPNATS